MAYTPPAYNAVDDQFPGVAYAPPAFNAAHATWAVIFVINGSSSVSFASSTLTGASFAASGSSVFTPTYERGFGARMIVSGSSRFSPKAMFEAPRPMVIMGKSTLRFEAKAIQQAMFAASSASVLSPLHVRATEFSFSAQGQSAAQFVGRGVVGSDMAAQGSSSLAAIAEQVRPAAMSSGGSSSVSLAADPQTITINFQPGWALCLYVKHHVREVTVRGI